MKKIFIALIVFSAIHSCTKNTETTNPEKEEDGELKDQFLGEWDWFSALPGEGIKYDATGTEVDKFAIMYPRYDFISLKKDKTGKAIYSYENTGFKQVVNFDFKYERKDSMFILHRADFNYSKADTVFLKMNANSSMYLSSTIKRNYKPSFPNNFPFSFKYLMIPRN